MVVLRLPLLLLLLLLLLLGPCPMIVRTRLTTVAVPVLPTSSSVYGLEGVRGEGHPIGKVRRR
jgi:hypothetical protein